MEDINWAAAPAAELSHDGLSDVRRDFPNYRIWREIVGYRVRYAARGLRLGARPYAVVAADLGELRAALAAGGEPGAGGEAEYPQAIADDYPGWDVTRDGGLWTERCPAVIVGAPTGAALRAAIERAIGGED